MKRIEMRRHELRAIIGSEDYFGLDREVKLRLIHSTVYAIAVKPLLLAGCSLAEVLGQIDSLEKLHPHSVGKAVSSLIEYRCKMKKCLEFLTIAPNIINIGRGDRISVNGSAPYVMESIDIKYGCEHGRNKMKMELREALTPENAETACRITRDRTGGRPMHPYKTAIFKDIASSWISMEAPHAVKDYLRFQADFIKNHPFDETGVFTPSDFNYLINRKTTMNNATNAQPPINELEAKMRKIQEGKDLMKQVQDLMEHKKKIEHQLQMMKSYGTSPRLLLGDKRGQLGNVMLMPEVDLDPEIYMKVYLQSVQTDIEKLQGALETFTIN